MPTPPLSLPFLAILTLASADTGHARLPVIVDTDGAPDDLRAIGLLLRHPEVELIAVTTVDGVVAPARSAELVGALLATLGVAEIPVAAGSERIRRPPACRAFAENLDWGDVPENFAALDDAPGLILDSLAAHDDPVALLALGPLTNLAAALDREPGLASELRQVIWYGDADAPYECTNHDLDPRAARTVLAAELPLRGARSGDDPALRFDASSLEVIAEGPDPLALAITQAFTSEEARARASSGHLGFWDELAVLALLEPDLMVPTGARTWGPADPARVRQELLEMMSHGPHSDGVVLEHLPDDPVSYRHDVQPWVERIQAAHGHEEWRLAVLTSELHRHLGIWTIVGVKMGLRARELLGAEHDELAVLTSAGLDPPLSCMNDGLQVSTGATLGHGGIRVDPATPALPQASFQRGDQRVTLQLRPELAAAIRADLHAEVQAHGGTTPAYFEAIRALSLRWWLELDRREAFEVIEPAEPSEPPASERHHH